MVSRRLGILVLLGLVACGDDGAGADDGTGAATHSATAGTDGGTDDGSADGSDSGSDDSGSASATGGDACEAPTGLLSVGDVVLDEGHPCADWLDLVRGRVAHNGFATMAVWSTRTDSGVGLFVSANHVLGQDWYGPAGQDVPRGLAAPDPNAGIVRLSLPPASGDLDELWGLTPMFSLFNSEIPAAETGNGLTEILPVHDYYVGIIDAQRLDDSGGIAPSPEALQLEPLPLYDPAGLAADAQTWSDASPGEDAIVMGYPANELSELGAFSVGTILTDDEAEAAIEELADAGDEEGQIPYEPDVEFMLRGAAFPGMSGGGAFDADGRLLGVLVRASETEPQYIRVVRMSWIRDDVAEAYDLLDDHARAAVAPFLANEL